MILGAVMREKSTSTLEREAMALAEGGDWRVLLGSLLNWSGIACFLLYVVHFWFMKESPFRQNLAVVIGGLWLSGWFFRKLWKSAINSRLKEIQRRSN